MLQTSCSETTLTFQIHKGKEDMHSLGMHSPAANTTTTGLSKEKVNAGAFALRGRNYSALYATCQTVCEDNWGGRGDQIT